MCTYQQLFKNRKKSIKMLSRQNRRSQWGFGVVSSFAIDSSRLLLLCFCIPSPPDPDSLLSSSSSSLTSFSTNIQFVFVCLSPFTFGFLFVFLCCLVVHLLLFCTTHLTHLHWNKTGETRWLVAVVVHTAHGKCPSRVDRLSVFFFQLVVFLCILITDM